MTDKMKFGLIGAGGIAQAYAQAFEGTPTTQLVAVADVRPEAAKALAERLGAEHYPSYEAMVSSEQLDAVIICTPPTTHLEISTYCLENGINVLCEKPLSVDSNSAKAMISKAQEQGLILTMASKFRYVDDMIKAKSLMLSGVLGEVVLFENAFTARVDMTNRWNSNPAISGGGVLIDNGTHSIDIMRYFLGPLAQVQVVEGKRVQELAVEDTVQIFAKAETGVMGNVDLSWSINKDLDYYVRIYGSQGTISVGWKESKYKQTSSPDWVNFGSGYNKVQAFQNQIENFANAIRGIETLLITAEDALASVEVMEAAYQAMNQTQWTAVQSTLTTA
ncbi:Gfo/Idh/MocA family oxidoreductase [filamentous cyanobacterium LEGE 11480]|uniref:Gfo/Idh/MocA family oxidoreductase n=1 Tax=Romeriopsis navalis LEGE 11480 TaxID=2777977 RepID=A0A928VNU0_9CYAN|nr:Gfo/Idh/MocA family oxidoreductase [Romeriopsis navalis]MBE9031941.1 Gfo/Idh/MocA family oxidoreductase [Romeriopsis navalis LEGE 11480]